MKLSIITINYNNDYGLLKTIKSVLCQTFVGYEYIIIDGGSTDNSVNIIKQYEKKIKYWKSEKDKGVYHAMNKGLQVANGEYVLMLNSGDVLHDLTTLEQVFSEKSHNEDILYGNLRWENNGVFHSNSDFSKKIDFKYFWSNSIGHQASFIKKEAHKTVGLYDENMKISSDWKFFLLAKCKFSLSFKYLPYIIAIGDCNGMSWDSANFYDLEIEKKKTFQTYFPESMSEYKKFQRKNNPILKLKIINLKFFVKNWIRKIL